ncbi:MAG: helix-turn-helix transcriptional regulator [Spirochaetia bacterium]|nr:helix-turn-helix transcriptional regulator [Spirochaetia bacterium]
MQGSVQGRPAGRAAVMRALIEAAVELFSSRSYGEVGVRELASKAGVNPALVHLYFESKEDVLREASMACFGRLEERMRFLRASSASPSALASACVEQGRYLRVLLTALCAPLRRPLPFDGETVLDLLAMAADGTRASASGDARDVLRGIAAAGIGFLMLERAAPGSGNGGEAAGGRIFEETYPRLIEAALAGLGAARSGFTALSPSPG